MSSKKGRKNVYDSKIGPRFSDIKKWLNKGATERSIAKNLGVAYSTFNKYKAEKIELMELLKGGRELNVDEVEGAMYRSALGEVKLLKKAMKVKKTIYVNGKKDKEIEVMEPYMEEVYIPPNVTAGIFLLKCWGKNRGYSNDPALLELKKEELQLKKDKLDNDW